MAAARGAIGCKKKFCLARGLVFLTAEDGRQTGTAGDGRATTTCFEHHQVVESDFMI